jgi:uncharacterized ParB-like nuclease family protein
MLEHKAKYTPFEFLEFLRGGDATAQFVGDFVRVLLCVDGQPNYFFFDGGHYVRVKSSVVDRLADMVGVVCQK